jgi:hypothetical protein
MLVIVALTPLCLIAGIVLIIWQKTRPLGLYVLMIEPGGVVGLILAVVAWGRFLHPVGFGNETESMVWIVVGLMFLWFGFGALVGALAGFTLATWLWWRYSPEPYRPLITKWYRSISATRFPFRQRWGRAHAASIDSADPF